MNKYPASRNKKIVVEHTNNEILIYNLSENKAFSLNETAAVVWRLCDGKTSISDITQKLNEMLKSSVSDEFVWLALDQLKKENLIEGIDDSENPFEGVNRREIIKRIGFGPMVALPIVSSIIAPSVANAQSNCEQQGAVIVSGYQQPTGSGQCQTQCTSVQMQCCSNSARAVCSPFIGGNEVCDCTCN